MVKMWAEKEFRNLNRLQAADIPSPKPVILRQHVLVMEFIGTDGVAAPRLKARIGAAIVWGKLEVTMCVGPLAR